MVKIILLWKNTRKEINSTHAFNSFGQLKPKDSEYCTCLPKIYRKLFTNSAGKLQLLVLTLGGKYLGSVAWDNNPGNWWPTKSESYYLNVQKRGSIYKMEASSAFVHGALKPQETQLGFATNNILLIPMLQNCSWPSYKTYIMYDILMSTLYAECWDKR